MSYGADPSFPPADPTPEAFAKFGEILNILHSDKEESDIAEQVWAFDAGSLECQLATWLLLSGSEQRAWRAYREMAARRRRLL